MRNEKKTKSLEIKLCLSIVYKVFSPYLHINKFSLCNACYSEGEISDLQRLPVANLDTNLAKKLLWEALDHWESPELYKRFLPRILEVMVPPDLEEDLYPEHLFEVLVNLDFRIWKYDEKIAVYNLLNVAGSIIYPDPEDHLDFCNQLTKLKKLVY